MIWWPFQVLWPGSFQFGFESDSCVNKACLKDSKPELSPLGPLLSLSEAPKGEGVLPHALNL